ncbi:NADPH:quinone oxidoreductase family protein [Myxococcota bacterium]|nr:NADPH:quinone oxidoreductase family protein [Myxococcota bacterium]
MKAVICHAFGPPENLKVEDVPEPEAAEGQLLVDVKAAGVSFPDALMVEDKYQMHPTPPYCPGTDVAGEVLTVGPGVQGFAVGDRVFGGARDGGFAERAVMDASGAAPIPDGMSFADATGIAYAYGTALYALRDRGALQAGETLVVLGAGGNVGISAVELGHALGARVIAAASTDEKLAFCIERGADETINYEREDLKQRIKELTQGRGADVVYDAVGGAYSEAALRATAWEGRFLVIGFTAGIAAPPLNLPLLKGCQIVGVFFGAMMARQPDRRDALLSELVELCTSGKLKPQASQSYPLEQAGQALRDLLDRRAVGKLVVAP